MSCSPRRGEVPRRAGTLSLSSVFAVSLREGTRRCGEPLFQGIAVGAPTPRDTALAQREALLRIELRGGGRFSSPHSWAGPCHLLPGRQTQPRREDLWLPGDGVGESHLPGLQLQRVAEVIHRGIQKYRIKGVIDYRSSQPLHVETNLVGATSPRSSLVEAQPIMLGQQSDASHGIRLARNLTSLQDASFLDDLDLTCQPSFVTTTPSPARCCTTGATNRYFLNTFRRSNISW